jgi:hypothetical protein
MHRARLFFAVFPWLYRPARMFFGAFPFLISNKPTQLDLQRKRFYDSIYGPR